MKIIDHRRPVAVPLREIEPGIGEGKGFRFQNDADSGTWYAAIAASAVADCVEIVSHGGLIRCEALDTLVYPVTGSEPAKVRFGRLVCGDWFIHSGRLSLKLDEITSFDFDPQAKYCAWASIDDQEVLVTPIPDNQIEIHIGRKPNEGNAEYWEGAAKDFSRKLGEARARSNYEAIGRFACEELLDEDSHDLESMKWALQDLQKPTASGQEKIAVDNVEGLAHELAASYIMSAGERWRRAELIEVILRKHVAERAEPSLAADREALVQELWEDANTRDLIRDIVAKHTIPAADLRLERQERDKLIAALREELAAAREAMRKVLDGSFIPYRSVLSNFFDEFPDKATASGQEKGDLT